MGFTIALFAQLILQEINPKGWCAVRTLHIAIAFVIHSVDPTRNQPQRLVRSAHPTYSYRLRYPLS